MRKTYNFVCAPSNNFDLDTNPLSSMSNYTLNQAYKWARCLAKFNTSYRQVEFKSEGGRKIHSVKIGK